jgi:hypothetical protein
MWGAGVESRLDKLSISEAQESKQKRARSDEVVNAVMKVAAGGTMFETLVL